MNSQPYSLEDLRDRLLKLENQNRRFKQLGAAVLVIAAIIAVMGQVPAKKTIEANEFVLRDSSGKVRASLSVNEKSKTMSIAQLILFGPDGSQRASIDSGFPLSGGAVTLSDSDGPNTTLAARFLGMTGIPSTAGLVQGLYMVKMAL